MFIQYYVDISGVCNLACPSCPVGNTKDSECVGPKRSKKFMSFALFQAILNKIEQENDEGAPVLICLYNWGEPLLHPDFYRIIEYIRQKGFYSDVSTNLNIKSIESVLCSVPDKLIISMSGYRQSIYGMGHLKGDTNLLLSNLHKVSELHSRLNREVIVEVFYHIYIDNMGEDVERVMTTCKELGFNFFADIAFFMPLEKNIAYLEQGYLNPNDEALLDRLLISPKELSMMGKPYQRRHCGQQKIISIRSDGSVSLCFPTYDRTFTVADSFLTITRSELLSLKQSHDFCHLCKAHCIHAVVAFDIRSELNSLIDERLAVSGSQFRMARLAERNNPDSLMS